MNHVEIDEAKLRFEERELDKKERKLEKEIKSIRHHNDDDIHIELHPLVKHEPRHHGNHPKGFDTFFGKNFKEMIE